MNIVDVKTYDGELDISGVVWVAHSVPKLIDVLDPLAVALQFICGEADNLDTALLELLLLAGNLTKLSRADLIKITTLVIDGHYESGLLRGKWPSTRTGVKSAG